MFKPERSGSLRATLANLKLVGSSPHTPRLQSQVLADALWAKLREEAREALESAPMLAPLFLESILNRRSFEAATFHRVASRLKNDLVGTA